MSEPLSKQEIRERVWRALEIHGGARFPGAKGRIPDFTGAERAALHLRDLPEGKRARVVKIDSDAPQLSVRRMALREGKIVYMAVPRLRASACFIEVDPARLGANSGRAAGIQGAAGPGRAVAAAAPPPPGPAVGASGAGGPSPAGARGGGGGGVPPPGRAVSGASPAW